MEAETPVVDFGAHYHTTVPSGLDGLHDVIGPIAVDPSAYADWFRDGGYDAAVLSQPYYLGYDDPEFTKTVNDELLEVVEEHEMFYGLAAIPTAAGPEVAAAEFERCLSNGYHGGAMAVQPDGISLASEANAPTFEVADSAEASILVHPTSNDRLSTPWFVPQYQNDMAFGREAALCSAISTVIHEEILERYPNLSLVFHHMGGNIASMLGRVKLRLDADRWGRSGSAKSFEMFRKLLKSRIYIDTSGYFGYHNSLNCAKDVFEPSQILLGTDAPYEPRTQEELAAYLEGVRDHASDANARRILGGTALELLVNL